MGISLIMATGNDGVIGYQGELPWEVKGDLDYFRRVTEGHNIIMGRKTFESLPGVLQNRFHLVLSSQDKLSRHPMVRFFKSRDDILNVLTPAADTFVIGGAETYKQFLDVADRAYITRIRHDFIGDTYFTYPFDTNGWKLISNNEGIINEKSPYPHNFQVFERTGYRYDYRGGN